MTIFILNGPNLNLLGSREPEIYGKASLDDIKAALEPRAAKAGRRLDFRQSNHEGDLVDWVQLAGREGKGLLINPGAYSHSSIAIYDALRAISIPKIEVHLSNVHAREEFRRRSVVSPAVDGVICGLGAYGYAAALDALIRLINKVSFP